MDKRFISVIISVALMVQIFPSPAFASSEIPDISEERIESSLNTELEEETYDPVEDAVLSEETPEAPDEDVEESEAPDEELEFSSSDESSDYEEEAEEIPDFSESGEEIDEGIDEESFDESSDPVPDDENEAVSDEPALQGTSSSKKEAGEEDKTIQLIDVVPGDSSVSPTWGSDAMQFSKALQIISEGNLTEKLTVAVIDSGINASHELFAGRISDKSRSFIHSDSSDYSDENPDGHGTHVAGIIAANTPECVDLMVLQVLDAEGRGTPDHLISAIRYALNNGADIINMSLSASRSAFSSESDYRQFASLLEDTLSSFEEDYSLNPIVVSAGNEGKDIAAAGTLPANSIYVITVGASDRNYALSANSNYGEKVDFCAPGDSICSAGIGSGDAYEYLSGTSMAAPFVTAALVDMALLTAVEEGGVYNCGGAIGDLELMAEFYGHDCGAGTGSGMPVFTDNYIKSRFLEKNRVQDRPVIDDAFFNGESITLEWTAVDGVSYRILRDEDEEWPSLDEDNSVGEVTGGTFVDENVVKGKRYVYAIEALDADDLYRDTRSDNYYIDAKSNVSNWDVTKIADKEYVKPGEKIAYLRIQLNPPGAEGYRIECRTEDPKVAEAYYEESSGTVYVSGKSCGSTELVISEDRLNWTGKVNVQSDDNRFCGDHVRWQVDRNGSDATLTITGYGTMYRYKDFSDLPWYEYTMDINRLVIGPDVEGFETSLFSNLFLKEISVSGTNPYYSSDGYSLFDKEKSLLLLFSKKITGTYTIPEPVRYIEKGAFDECQLSQVSLPNGLWKVNTFRNCPNLSKVEVPDSVKFIDDGSFSQCPLLKEIHFPDALKKIGNSAFENTPLKAAVLPEGLTYIGDSAFRNSGISELKLPDTVVYIGYSAFSGTEIREVILPDNDRLFVNYNAFNNCKALHTVYLSAYGGLFSLYYIDDEAFAECDHLSDLYFSGFTKEFKDVIGYRSPLSKAKIHIKKEGETGNLKWTAEGDSGNLTLTLSGSGAMPDYGNASESPWFSGADEITRVVVKSGVTHLGSYAFCGYGKLANVLLPGTVKSYGNNVFRWDPLLEQFRFSMSNKEIICVTPQYLLAVYEPGVEFRPDMDIVNEAGQRLKAGSDFDIRYKNTSAVGEGLITVQFTGTYSSYGSVCLPLIICSKLLNGDKFKTIRACTIKYKENYPYTGNYIELIITVKNDYSRLKKGIDYTVEYIKKKKPGDYSFRIRGIGGYTGRTDLISYSIKKIDISKKTINLSPLEFDYTGRPRTPKVTINGLKKDRDFKYKYINNIRPGTATVIITGIGNCTGQEFRTFTIKKKKKSQSSIISIKGKTVELDYNDVRKKKKTIKRKKAITVSKAHGKITFEKVKGSGRFSVSSKGIITVKKGTRGSYTIKIRVTASGDDNYMGCRKTVPVTIKIS